MVVEREPLRRKVDHLLRTRETSASGEGKRLMSLAKVMRKVGSFDDDGTSGFLRLLGFGVGRLKGRSL